ncbi:MAG: trypsin-like peptidase domain-containing protein [Verrucomicrobiota bacterium]
MLFSVRVTGKESGLKPEEIYNLVSGSVAVIRDLDSHGSGVVLTREGLILTNYHVVASGLPLSISVRVEQGGKLVEKSFDNVEVSKVHPDYDLALLKIDFPGGRFLPAKLLGKNDEIVTGSACYAIGNPGGADGTALVHSITEGLVSASARKIDGEDYIQTSAALNPGNSGGAVADSQGRVIGIATWKLDQADNIGFAIPLQSLKLEQFIPLAKKKSDPELAVKYEKEAGRLADYAQQVDGDERVLAIRMAAFYYRKSLEAVPNDPAPYNNLGTMYFRLEEDTIARRYLERALQIRPLYASSMSMLGIIIARGKGDLKVANDLWFRGTEDKESPGAASDCAENLAISYVNAKEYAAAAYCIRWANVLQAAPAHREPVRKKIWEESVEKLSEAQFAILKAKETDFSRTGLEAFAKGAGLRMPPSPAAAVNAPAAVEPASEAVQPDAKSYAEAAAKMAAAGIDIPAEGLTKPLPGVPDNIIMGYAGSCLLMKFPELKRIGVFDLCQAKITKYINLTEDDAIFAAGGKVLLIYYPGGNRFELWDMESWTKKKDIALRSDRPIAALGMGLLNHGFAVVSRAESNGQDQDKIAILSIPEGKLTVPEFKQSPKGMSLGHLFGHLGTGARISVEENGSSALIMGGGRGFLNLANRSSVEASYVHIGSVQDGSIAFGGSAVVIDNMNVYRPGEEEDLLRKIDLKQKLSPRREAVAIVSGYRGIVEMRMDDGKESKLTIRSLPELNEVSSIPLDPEVYRNFRSGGHQSRLFASAYVKRIAILGGKDHSITVFRMPDASAKVSSEITAGSSFSRTLTFAEGTKALIDSAPEGVVYDSKSGQIRWEIPKEQPRGVEVSVIFLLTDSTGKETYHIEKIVIP